MTKLLHFLRLVRFGNLMVIGATMCVIQLFIGCHEKDYPVLDQASAEAVFSEMLKIVGFNFQFLLLVLSVILIAGAGNIINDYFDVRADRVNKPNRLIVGVHIKRRWAIMFNWIFNVLGLGFALYLSYINANWWITIIAFLTINFLWFYSALFKRKLFVGNFLVAVMVGIVPIYVLIYNLPIKGFDLRLSQGIIELGPIFIYEVVIIISIIAFVINLMRELIKDMADVDGDLELSARTVPIALGMKQTKLILTLMLVPLLMLMAYYIYNIHYYSKILAAVPVKAVNVGINTALLTNITLFYVSVGLAAGFCIFSFVLLFKASERKHYIQSAKILKFAMLFGMISPLFLCYV